MSFRKAAQTIAALVYRGTTVGLAKGPHVTRYYMYNHLAQFAEPQSAQRRVLSVSHSEELSRLIGFRDCHITEANYPSINILHLPFPDGEFDAVVSDQVLEHVQGEPALAIAETFRVLKRGGTALHTTCFMNPIHGFPSDYWRFTPDGLRLLVQEHGEIVDVGGWGNLYVWFYNAIGLRFEPIPHARWHPAHWIATANAKSWPIVTWVLAKKR